MIPTKTKLSFLLFCLPPMDFSSSVLTWRSLGSRVSACVYPVRCCCFSCFFYWPRQPRKEKKKTDYQFEIHFPLHLPRPGHKHRNYVRANATLFSRSSLFFSSLNSIECVYSSCCIQLQVLPNGERLSTGLPNSGSWN